MIPSQMSAAGHRVSRPLAVHSRFDPVRGHRGKSAGRRIDDWRQLRRQGQSRRHTLLLIEPVAVLAKWLNKSVPYDVTNDFTPISLVATQPLVLFAQPSLPVNDVKELIAYCKDNPRRLSVGMAGAGSPHHLAAAWLNTAAKIEITHVPYRGVARAVAPALADLLGGQIPLIWALSVSVMPFVGQGKVKALGVPTEQRFSMLPKVPTVAESGVPEFDVDFFYGVAAPTKVQQTVVGSLLAQQGLLPAWYRIREWWGDVDPNTIAFEMMSKWRVELERLHSRDVAHMTIRVWRTLWTIMQGMKIAIGADPSWHPQPCSGPTASTLDRRRGGAVGQMCVATRLPRACVHHRNGVGHAIQPSGCADVARASSWVAGLCLIDKPMAVQRPDAPRSEQSRAALSGSYRNISPTWNGCPMRCCSACALARRTRRRCSLMISRTYGRSCFQETSVVSWTCGGRVRWRRLPRPRPVWHALRTTSLAFKPDLPKSFDRCCWQSIVR
jgi:hypothetical protein